MARAAWFMTFAAMAALTVVACTPASPPKTGSATQTAAATGCADGAAKLSATKLCPADAGALIDAPAQIAAAPALPQGCAWVVQDSPGLIPEEALIYVSAQCGERATKLELRGGAGSGAIGYVSSALRTGDVTAAEPIRLFVVSGMEPDPYVLNLSRQSMTNRRHAAACVVRAGTLQEAPLGVGVVVDVPAAYRTANRIPANQKVCGEYSAAAGSTAFWMARGPYAWWVDFAGAAPDFLPNSVNFVTVGPNGVTKTSP